MEIGKSFRYKEGDLENEDIKETRSDNSDGRKSANYETGSDKSEDGYQTARGEGRSIDYEIAKWIAFTELKKQRKDIDDEMARHDRY
jgi:hypothetical protein